MQWPSVTTLKVGLPLMLILNGVNGCATSTSALDDASFRLICSSPLAAPITYGADTPETIDQINAHNGAYECACNKDCPTAKP